MASMYYRGADAALLVFDVLSEKNSRVNIFAPFFFHKLKNIFCAFHRTDSRSLYSVKSWVKELQQHTDVDDDITLVIAANKMDLAPNSPQSKALYSEAQDYAREISAALFKTSAKSSLGINEVFEFIAKKVLEVKLRKGSMGDDDPVVQLTGGQKKDGPCCSLL